MCTISRVSLKLRLNEKLNGLQLFEMFFTKDCLDEVIVNIAVDAVVHQW